MISLKHLSWNPTEALLSCEESDLGKGGLQNHIQTVNMSHRLSVKSHITGNVQHFVLEAVHKDREGDVTHWTFIAADKTCRAQRLLIWND